MVDLNKIYPEFLGLTSINPFAAYTSSPRSAMTAQHFCSRASILKPEKPIVMSGIEYELGNVVNDIRAEENSILLGSVLRYAGNGVFSSIPEMLLFLEFERNGNLFIDCLSVPTYMTNDTVYGYDLTPVESIYNLYVGKRYNEGEVIAKTNSLMADGSYGYGINANVVHMSHPSCSEDQYVMSESFAKRICYTTIQKRVIFIDKNHLPLNLNGDDVNYKFLPDIGQKTLKDGLLCAYRKRNDLDNIIDMSNKSLKRCSQFFDRLTYVPIDSEVIDIKVTKNNFNKRDLSNKIYGQLDFYADLGNVFYTNIVSQYNSIMESKRRLYGDNVSIRTTPRLHNLLREAKMRTEASVNNKVKLTQRKQPIEHFRVEVFTRAVVVPNKGVKLMSRHADKGVAIVLPDHMMPVDKNGVRAEIITDDTSTGSRMNIGRTYEYDLGAFSRDNKHRLISYLKSRYGDMSVDSLIDRMDNEAMNYISGVLLKMYSIVNEDMFNFANSFAKEEWVNHIREVLNDNITLWCKIDGKSAVDIIRDLWESDIAPLNDRITYVDSYGVTVSPQQPITIGNSYTMVNYKNGQQMSAVASAECNNFGFPVKSGSEQKNSTPFPRTPIRGGTGETENRILVAHTSAQFVAEMVDCNSNPIVHKAVATHFLTAQFPTRDLIVVDRNIHPYGGNRALQMLEHIFVAGGSQLANTEEEGEV